MLQIALKMLKILARLLGILIAIPLVILGFMLAKVWFYDSIPKTWIPVASEAFIKRLPGIIIWDFYMISTYPENCEKYHCKVFLPNENKTVLLTPQQAKIYQQKYGNYCKSMDLNFPASPNGHIRLTTLERAYNQRTKQGTQLITEGRSIEAIDWSPDNRYALYRVEYKEPYDTSDPDFLYIITDLKTGETYRIIKNPESRMDTCWVNK